MIEDKKEEISDTHLEIFEKLQKSPIFFVDVMWDLIPQPLKPEYEERAREAIDECDWKAFKKSWFKGFVKGKHMTWQQWVILLALEAAVAGRAPKRISVSSGHGIGKDCTLAWIILWFLFCFKDAQIPCTAPTSDQLDDILWKEISKWHMKMPEEVKVQYDIRSEYIRMVASPKTWFARARTSKKETPEALAGVHGDYVLYVAEEASGIDEAIFNTAEGALTNQAAFFIMISNPTRLEGYFYNSHHDDKDNWQRPTFNGEDSPIVDLAYVERISSMHGIDSDEYKVRVKGQFPAKDIEMDGWIPILTRQEIDLAMEDSEDISHAGIQSIGIDVGAGGGGDTSTIIRRSMNIADIEFESARINNMELAGEAIIYIDDTGVDPHNVAVDCIGEGSGTYNRMVEQKYPVNGVNVANSPKDEIKFINLRAEAYWALRTWIKTGGKLRRDPRWYELLVIRYKTKDSSGKIQIMSKDLMRRKNIPSPNVADGLMLTFTMNLVVTKEISKEDVFFARKMFKKLNKKK